MDSIRNEGKDAFEINSQSGEVFTKQVFDREQKGAFALEVEARDGAPSARPNSGGRPNTGRRFISFDEDNPRERDVVTSYYQKLDLAQGWILTFRYRLQGYLLNWSNVLTHLLRIHLDPDMTGQPPWYTAPSLEPSELSPNQKAAAPLVGQMRRGLSLAKKVVAPPAGV